MRITVRQINEDDRADWLRMRVALWPGSPSEHDAETRSYFEEGGGDLVILMAEVDGAAVGFLELDQRKYAPGCEGSPVFFIEGWYVDPKAQRQGVGRALVEAAEQRVLAAGGVEIASDSEIENVEAHAAHHALGFEEIERVVCFYKQLRRG